MGKKNKRIAGEISKSLVNARLNEKKIQRQIRRIQKSETKLLKEVRILIDEGKLSEARLMAINVIDSRKLIQRRDYYVL